MMYVDDLENEMGRVEDKNSAQIFLRNFKELNKNFFDENYDVENQIKNLN